MQDVILFGSGDEEITFVYEDEKVGAADGKVTQEESRILEMVRDRLAALGWDCSPDDHPLSADYCPACSQGSNWRH